MRDLILVIDMQNAYKSGMPWACKSIERTIGNITRLLDKDLDAAITVFDAPENPEGAWINYTDINKDINEDEYANRLVREIEVYKDKYPVYHKSTYSALMLPELRKKVKSYDRVAVTGVVASCCVLSTVFSLIDMGIPYIYIEDAVSGIDEKNEENAKAVLSNLNYAHGMIITTEEYLESLST